MTFGLSHFYHTPSLREKKMICGDDHEMGQIYLFHVLKYAFIKQNPVLWSIRLLKTNKQKPQVVTEDERINETQDLFIFTIIILHC